MSNNSEIDRQARSLTQSVLKRITEVESGDPRMNPGGGKSVYNPFTKSGGGAPHPQYGQFGPPGSDTIGDADDEHGEVERPASEEKREVQIGDEIIAIIGVIRDVSSPESRQHGYSKIEALAQELIDMHSMPEKPEDEYESDSVHGKDVNK